MVPVVQRRSLLVLAGLAAVASLVSIPVHGQSVGFCSSLADPSVVVCDDFSGSNPLTAYWIINPLAPVFPPYASVSIVNGELMFVAPNNVGLIAAAVTRIQDFDYRGTSIEAIVRFDTPNAGLRSGLGIQWEGTTPNADILRFGYQLDERAIALSWGVGGSYYGDKKVPWNNATINANHHVRLEIEEISGTTRAAILAFRGYSDGILVINENEETLGINLSGLPERLHPSFSVATYTYSPISQVFDNLVVRKRIVLSCVGFDSPLNRGPVAVNRNRALPFKAQLFDKNSVPMTEVQLGMYPPVVQVQYDPGTLQTVDVTDLAVPAGRSSSGNQFVFSEGWWQYNLLTKNYTAPGTYTVTMAPGNGYTIQPTCAGSFVLK